MKGDLWFEHCDFTKIHGMQGSVINARELSLDEFEIIENKELEYIEKQGIRIHWKTWVENDEKWVENDEKWVANELKMMKNELQMNWKWLNVIWKWWKMSCKLTKNDWM